MGLWNTKVELVEDCLEELQKFLDSCPNLQTLQLYSVCAFQQLILLFRKYFIEKKKNSNLSFLQNISNASRKTRVWQNSSWMTRMTLLQTFSGWWMSSREKSCAMHCWEWRSALFSAHSWWDVSMDKKTLLQQINRVQSDIQHFRLQDSLRMQDFNESDYPKY